ncbi:MAG: hypothetical protein U0800_15595 [Isosphaeraceae bacterium]
MQRLDRALIFSLLPLLPISWGCGSSKAPQSLVVENQSLADVGEAYRVTTIANNRPPKKLDELLTAEGIGGNGLGLVRSGEILVRLDAALPSTGEEPGDGSSQEVLAYFKSVPESGGYVLMLDRTIKKMTAAEFASAPKAGKEPGTVSKKK